ncbi:MAG: alpha-glucan family phosphorylase [Candidatus Methanosuratincola sp.]
MKSRSGNNRYVAYFSMEIAIDSQIPTYSGGLGILAGDTIRSAADLGVQMVAVTLLHRRGYFYQRVDDRGVQTEEPIEWDVEGSMVEMPPRVTVYVEGRTVYIRCWKYEVAGIGSHRVPVYFLDSDLPENSEWDRTLTHYLYGGDERYRLSQEIVLGIGGVRMLRALGYDNIVKFHMNEGHSSLLSLELLFESARQAGREAITREDVEEVRRRCVFTTHTPVPSGHDQFPLELVKSVLGYQDVILGMKDVFCCEGLLNMTFLGLNLSDYVNGVAKRHGETSRMMFSRYVIDTITNGIHVPTWVSAPFQSLFDRYIPDWKADNFSLRYALGIPKQEIWSAHMEAKKQLIHLVNRETNAGMDPSILTIGFARRATRYKRWELIFMDIERLKSITSRAGQFQIIYSGKAHPRDFDGKEAIKRVFEARDKLRDHVKVAYLENYDMEIGKMMTSGSDIWLNTPLPPLEASGTSGMKAAVNGVPSLSVLDGWWIEGHIEGLTGWSIGDDRNHVIANGHDSVLDAQRLYEKLEGQIIPLFYSERERFIEVMRHTIALNGSFFNAQRMLQEYVLKAYFR